MAVTDQEDLAGRLWSLCHVLRDDGIVYHKYLSELTYLLFLKNAKQLGVEAEIPKGCRWDDLLDARGAGMLGFYRKLLTRLGEDVSDENLRSIFSFPTTVFSHDENLNKVVNGIQAINWHVCDRDALGLIYESLLERNATEARSGSGQYFTPRPLVNTMVSVMKPQDKEIIQDPAVGTGGFLIAAHRYSSQQSLQHRRYQGIEIERDTFRLCLMNLYLHGMNGRVIHGDALTIDSEGLPEADLILANPPFGVSTGGARKRREDLPHPTGNKQLAFLQYISLAIAPGGRAAVVVPDNVLFEPGVGTQVRQYLIEKLDLHTILRLPTGIFYAPGVRTHVLFFNKPTSEQPVSDKLWIYDLRTGMPVFSKRKALQDDDFKDFIKSFGDDSYGRSPRTESVRFKSFSKDDVRARKYDLDIRWAEEETSEDDPDLADLLAQMDDALTDARVALSEISTIISGTDISIDSIISNRDLDVTP
ncbi:class I SAM-dependent DNA methyltransferase [Pseudomonas sp. NY11382]|uniref:class I SAM-dependent DNA methyltransferase n=1 Tax=Pseudomonas sp. NY11382 TaxID=2939495 RepID=UPI0022DD8932|nr:N-6 DNA methylase [Pseudomonas sp. NY11382]WBM33118.1 type I restriction-modification system subunit M [Pseudomonas sp. NY11382]